MLLQTVRRGGKGERDVFSTVIGHYRTEVGSEWPQKEVVNALHQTANCLHFVSDLSGFHYAVLFDPIRSRFYPFWHKIFYIQSPEPSDPLSYLELAHWLLLAPAAWDKADPTAQVVECGNLYPKAM